MKKYEIMYIVKANLDEETRNNVIGKLHDILTKNGATIAKVDEWGIRDLAYLINDESKGYYIVLDINTENDTAIKEFNRLVRINPNVLRFLIIKK